MPHHSVFIHRTSYLDTWHLTSDILRCYVSTYETRIFVDLWIAWMPNLLQTSVRRQGNETARSSGFKGMLELVQGCAGVRMGHNLLQFTSIWHAKSFGHLKHYCLLCIVCCAFSIVHCAQFLRSTLETPSHFIPSHSHTYPLIHPLIHIRTCIHRPWSGRLPGLAPNTIKQIQEQAQEQR